MALSRSTTNKVLGGVCAGIGKASGIDPNILRIAFLAGFLLFGFGLIPYLLLWAVLPRDTGGIVAEEGLKKARGWYDDRKRSGSSDDYTV